MRILAALGGNDESGRLAGVEAVVDAAIGRTEDAGAILGGDAGTVITPRGECGGSGDLSPRH